MIRIHIKFNEYGDPYSDDDSVAIKIGQKIEFIFPDGTSECVRIVSVCDAVDITGGHACAACPFYLYTDCPTWSDQGSQYIYMSIFMVYG